MSRRSWVMLGVVTALLLGSAPAHMRADFQKEDLSWQLFVSTYYMFNAQLVPGPYNDLGFPYADSQGFGVSFAGGDFRYRTEKWGLRLDLRWGQNVDRLTELEPLSRGYAIWIPHPKVKLDFGYFAAFIGVENADEWRNPTFTRGVVYFKIQPFRHLGVRAMFQPHDDVDITVIVARGSIFGKSFPEEVRRDVQVPAVGAQLVYRVNRDADLRLGGVASPNGTNGNRNWQAIIDVIASWTPGAWNLFVNGDYQFTQRGFLTGTSDVRAQWGVSAGGSYQITDHWALGFRGEYAGDDRIETVSDETRGVEALGSLTGTVRYLPVQYLIISFEPRAEFSRDAIYFGRPIVTDPATGARSATLDQRWFFGFWLGVTAKIGSE